jgi:hypothetical protein
MNENYISSAVTPDDAHHRYLTPEQRAAVQVYLTPVQAASIIQVAPGTLANARVTGSLGLPFVKLTPGKRGAVRYRKSDVEAWMAARTYKNTQQAVVAVRKVEAV